MLTVEGVASPPASRIWATVVSSDPSSGWSPSRSVRAAQTTLPPSAAKTLAISAPIPRLAPVTTTTLSSSLPMCSAPCQVLPSFGALQSRASRRRSLKSVGVEVRSRLRGCNQSRGPAPTRLASARTRPSGPPSGRARRSPLWAATIITSRGSSPQQVGRAQVALRVRLVVLHQLGEQYAVPGQAPVPWAMLVSSATLPFDSVAMT